MFLIKLYKSQDLVSAYLKSWGYEDDKILKYVTSHILSQDEMKDINIISDSLDRYLINYLNEKMPQSTLSDTEKLNYFKMIFLKEKCYEKCNIFSSLSDQEEAYLHECFQENNYHVAPNMIVTDMFAQSIKTYHPVVKVKKAFLKGIKHILPHKKS